MGLDTSFLAVRPGKGRCGSALGADKPIPAPYHLTLVQLERGCLLDGLSHARGIHGAGEQLLHRVVDGLTH